MCLNLTTATILITVHESLIILNMVILLSDIKARYSKHGLSAFNTEETYTHNIRLLELLCFLAENM